jgi:hypothetical protein
MAPDDRIFAIDIDFLDACRRAANMIKSRRSRDDRVAATSALAEILLSERHLGPGERRYLAELLSGDLDRPPGHRLSADERKTRREQVSMVRQYQQHTKLSVPDAVQALADDGKLNKDEVERLINFMSQSRRKS